jgi:hypothetical protein
MCLRSRQHARNSSHFSRGELEFWQSAKELRIHRHRGSDAMDLLPDEAALQERERLLRRAAGFGE